MQNVISIPPAPNKNSNPSAATAAAYSALVSAFKDANTTISALQATFENSVAADAVAAVNATVAAE